MVALSVRSPIGAWPAVLCAKSLRRSVEVALCHQSSRFLDRHRGRSTAAGGVTPDG
jgi:hypothetical protein